MLSKIAITGFEVSTALGDEMNIIWERLLNNESALKEYEFLKNEKRKGWRRNSFFRTKIKQPLTRVWQKWRFNAQQTHLW